MELTTCDTWTIEHTGERPLTLNKLVNLHRMAWAAHTKRVRRDWALLARQAHIPPLLQVHVTATPLHKDGRSPQDVAAAAPEVKAAVDGLVDAGVMADDSPTWLHSITFTAPDVCGRDGLRIVIEGLVVRGAA